MKKFVVALFLIAFVFTALAGPNDSKSGIYFAPMLTSGHFGVLAHNTPEVYNTVSPRTLSLSTTDLAPDRGLSFGGKLGIFFRPEVHERKNRLDVEVQFEYAPGKFWFQTIDATNTLYEQDYWLLDNKTITGRFRWSADVGDRFLGKLHEPGRVEHFPQIRHVDQVVWDAGAGFGGRLGGAYIQSAIDLDRVD